MAKMLRDTFFVQALYDKTFKELDDRLNLMQEHAADVCTALNIRFATVDDVERCTVENIKADMARLREQERDRFRSVLFCDDDYLTNMDSRHKRLLQQWTPLVNSLQADVTYFRSRGIALVLDSKGKVWAKEADRKRYATEHATVTFTPEDKALYTKLGELVELLKELSAMQPINYNYLLKYHLTDRSAPLSQYGQLLGEIKGLSITQEKFYNMRFTHFGTAGAFGTRMDDVII